MTEISRHGAEARSGPRIRQATPGDYDAFARLFPELGPEFPVPPAEAWTGGQFADAVVAEVGGAVAGYALGTTFDKLGHLSQLVVAPSHRRGGIGRLLAERVAARFVATGCDRWQLNVKRANVAARALYEGMGFRQVSTCAWVSLPPDAIRRLPFMPCHARPVPPARDAEVDRAFDLRTGQLAWSRAHPGTLLHEVVDAAGGLLGFGAYVQATRFVVPLRLRRHEALAPLLASFPHAVEQGARIGIEEDEALAALALRCGGTLDLETDRLVGPLPLTRG